MKAAHPITIYFFLMASYYTGSVASSGMNLIATMPSVQMAPRVHPIIIPGKKRPDGTFVPYVVIVKKYHTAKKVKNE